MHWHMHVPALSDDLLLLSIDWIDMLVKHVWGVGARYEKHSHGGPALGVFLGVDKVIVIGAKIKINACSAHIISDRQSHTVTKQ